MSTKKKKQPSPGRIRPARMGDVRAIHSLLMFFAAKNLMLPRSISSLYDHLRDFVVYEQEERIVGICALHIAWDNLAEIRSLAVLEEVQQSGIGALLVESCLDEARSLEISTVLVLTYQAGFFKKFGFKEKDKQELPHKIWSDCINCSKFPDCDEDALVYTTNLEDTQAARQQIGKNPMPSWLVRMQSVFDRQCNHAFTTQIVNKSTSYCLVYIPTWPKAVHYKFLESKGIIYAECHIENDQYVQSVGKILQKLADIFQEINGYKLEYYASRPWPRRKKNPSLTLQLGCDISNDEAAKVMLEFIRKTEPYITPILSC